MVKVDRKNADAKAPANKDKGLFVTIFTDGSYCPNTTAWGVGIWIRYSDDKPVELSLGGLGDHDNIYQVELYGLYHAFDCIMENYDLVVKVVVLQCDNVGAVTTAFNTHAGILKTTGVKFVKAKHVKAHTNNATNRTKINRIVDRLAGVEMRKYRKIANSLLNELHNVHAHLECKLSKLGVAVKGE